ncbi:MAG: metallo-mystery pair system four-Cys motif protein [Psychrosphaera sp.]|nr:metallo-mystery pair system four-Cys motif protein [Psychrosphaera sp.]
MPITITRLFTAILAAILLSACSKPIPVTIPFTLTYHDQPVSCGEFGPSTANITLKDFRLYLHQIELQNKDGDWSPLTLDSNSLWQNDSTALLDFENGSSDCQGNPGTNTTLTGTLPSADYQAIRFVIGVPFELNHQNPLIALAPLNESSMHWHWQGGYKFVRAEFSVHGKSRRQHVRSLQCKGEINAISHCEKPNRVPIELADYTNGPVVIALDKLLDFSQPENKSNLTCMGGSDNPWCLNGLDWIGLNDNKPQMAFKAGIKVNKNQ